MIKIKNFSKKQKRHLKELSELAHEREISQALDELLQQFDIWKKGEINSFELNEKIHKYHDGISRELYKHYVYGEPDFSVAGAIVKGIIKKNEVDEQILLSLNDLIKRNQG